MKKLIPIGILLVLSLSSFGQQDHNHLDIISYRFPKMHIIMANQFMIDSSTKYSPSHISFPYGERKFGVYASYLAILITDNTNPFKEHPWGRANIDTSAAAASRMKLEDLQYSINYNNGERITDWKDITEATLLKPWANNQLILPTTSKYVVLNKGRYYKVLIDAVEANQTEELVLRNKHTQEELIRFRYMGMGNPVKPYLAVRSHDSTSNRTIEEFMEREMAGKGAISLPGIDTFYANWPEKYSGKIINQQLFKSSKLALYFRKPGPEYKDSSLEYRLLSESNTDTTWIRTGHRLFISDLKSGHHYRLQIRYISYPDRIQEHTFYLESEWYQKLTGKIIIGIGLLLLLLLVTLIIYRRRIRRTREKMESLRLEMKGLHSQLNPHFVFNALSSIQGLINKNDIVNANLYLTEFSTLLRESLKNNEKETIPLSEEFRLLNTYLRLEQVRFGFQYTLVIDPSINASTTEIPPLLFQPIVENAVKHGAGPLHGNGRIDISCKPSGNALMITITDNGAGFTTAPEENGFGIKLTMQRIRLLNKTLRKQSIELAFDPSKTSGTTVHLIFKNWL